MFFLFARSFTIFYLGCVWLLFLSSAAWSLTMDKAVRTAMENNPYLRARLKEIGIKEGEYQQASLVANPEMELEFMPERDSQLEFRVEYNIISWVLTPLRKKANRLELEAVRYHATAQVIELGLAVRRAFYAMQAAESQLQVARIMQETFAADQDAAQALRAAGNITEVERGGREIAYEQMGAWLLDLEFNRIRARERLNRLLGVSGEQLRWQIEGTLESIPEKFVLPPNLEQRAMDASLERKEIQRQLQAMEQRVTLTNTEGWLPQLNVDFHLLSGNPNDINGAANLRYGGGVKLSLPIFDHQQGHRRTYEAKRAVLRERLLGVELQIRSSIREAEAKVEAAHKRALLYQNKLLPAQKKLLAAVMLQYNAMQIGVFDLLRAKREQLQTELAWVSALQDYWTATTELDAILLGKYTEQEEMLSNKNVDKNTNEWKTTSYQEGE